jgi:hypothetical protein
MGRLLTLTVLLLCSGLAPAFGTPVLTLDAQTAIVDGATPGGQVAWLAVSRRPMETHQRIEIVRELSEVDSSGRTVLALQEPVTLKSVWVAVDLATGDYAITVPAEAVLRERALVPNAFVSDAAGAITSLRHDRLRIEALVARPAAQAAKAEVWAGQLSDGGALDAGPPYDGRVELRLASLPALGQEASAAESFAAGDVVVLLDPERLEVSAVRLEEAATGQGGER